MDRHNKDGLHPVDPEEFVDVGCLDYDEAREQRKRIADKQANAKWWRWLRKVVAAAPWGEPLPPEIPVGRLPEVDMREIGEGRHLTD